MSYPSNEPLPIDRFDYDLPPELIAQSPAEPRDSARLLVVRRRDGSLTDTCFSDLPDLLAPGDLLVMNDTRVLPARLFARRSTGGRVEVLLLSRRADNSWSALARPSRKLRPGDELRILGVDDEPSGEVITVGERIADGFTIRFSDERAIERHGRVPLPPYIQGQLSDPERYQTVYARESGSAAAPTAGLHFTPELLQRCHEAGIETARVTLHVGLDTFQPIKVADARDHAIHSEWFHVPAETATAIRETRSRRGRVVAVGTTSVRTLESAVDRILTQGDDTVISGQTRLYITPGYQFRLVDAMITNFHLPRTSLLLLVSAFAGEAAIRRAYAHAIEERYRFYSFGDATLLI